MMALPLRFTPALIPRRLPARLPRSLRPSTILCSNAGEVPLAREQRKLAAILAADVVGYSRLMGRDESGTLARLRKNRSERLDPILTRYGERLVTSLAVGLKSTNYKVVQSLRECSWIRGNFAVKDVRLKACQIATF